MSEKRKTKTTSSHYKTCSYSQVYNVNPLMGGFISFGDKYENSVFNSYQFTGKYKVNAQDNYVSVITTETCSQASVNFYKALVVFQPIVEPMSRETDCSQEIIFNENKYVIEINPFERYDIDVGTLILASNGVLTFTTFDLPSKTNQEKISKALYDYILRLSSGIVYLDDNGNEINDRKGLTTQNIIAMADTPYINPEDHKFLLYADPPANGYQYVSMFTSSSKWIPGVSSWYVREDKPGVYTPVLKPDTNGKYKLKIGPKYKIGFSSKDKGIGYYVVYQIYTTPLVNGLVEVKPLKSGLF